MKHVKIWPWMLFAILFVAAGNASAITLSGITVDSVKVAGINFSASEYKYVIRDANGTQIGDSLAADTDSVRIGGLYANTKYVWYVEAVGTGFSSYPDSCFTRAATPTLPALTWPSSDSAKIMLGTDANPYYTQYATQDSITGKFVDSLGDSMRIWAGVNSLPDWGWKTRLEWGAAGRTFKNSGAGKTHRFRAYARSARIDTSYALLLDLSLSRPDTALGPELITNGTMAGGATPPSGWVISGSGIGVSSTDAHTGTYSLKGYNLTANANIVRQNNIPVTSSKTYRLSVWQKKTYGNGLSLFIRIGSDATTGDKRVNLAGSSASWSEKTSIFAPGASAVSIGIGATATTDTGLVDDVSLKEYWLRDFSRYQRHASPDTVPSWVTVGNVSCMDFNGYTTRLNTGSDFIGTGNVAVEFVAVVDSLGEGGEGRILTNGKFVVFVGADNTINVSSDSVTVTSSDDSVFVIGTPFHCWILRASSGGVTMYVNNVETGTPGAGAGTPAAGTGNVIIGNRLAGDRAFNGRISMLRIYSQIPDATFRASRWTTPIQKSYGL